MDKRKARTVPTGAYHIMNTFQKLSLSITPSQQESEVRLSHTILNSIPIRNFCSTPATLIASLNIKKTT
jgi:hypothetical protein